MATKQVYSVWKVGTVYKFRWGRKVLEIPVTANSQRQLTTLLAQWAEAWYNEHPDEDPERNPEIAPD